MKNKGFITMMIWILLGFGLVGCSHQEEDKEIETIVRRFLREVIILNFHRQDEEDVYKRQTQVVIQANRKINAMTQRPLSPNSEVTASVSVCAPLAPIGMPEREVPNSVNMM